MGVSDLSSLIVFVLPGYVASTIMRLLRKHRDVPAGEKVISCLLFSLFGYFLISLFPNSSLAGMVVPLFDIELSQIASSLRVFMFGVLTLLAFFATLGVFGGLFFLLADPRIEGITGHTKDNGLWNRVFSPRPFDKIWNRRNNRDSKRVYQHAYFMLKNESTLYQADIDECDDIGEHILLLKNVLSKEDGKDWKSFHKKSGKMLINFDQIKYIYLIDPTRN